MPGAPLDRRELERYWKERCSQAKLELEAARAHVQSIKQDVLSGPYGADGAYAYARAIKGETSALIEYSRTLRIYTDLVSMANYPTMRSGKPRAGTRSSCPRVTNRVAEKVAEFRGPVAKSARALSLFAIRKLDVGRNK